MDCDPLFYRWVKFSEREVRSFCGRDIKSRPTGDQLFFLGFFIPYCQRPIKTAQFSRMASGAGLIHE